jgi:hypothetical protein
MLLACDHFGFGVHLHGRFCGAILKCVFANYVLTLAPKKLLQNAKV